MAAWTHASAFFLTADIEDSFVVRTYYHYHFSVVVGTDLDRPADGFVSPISHCNRTMDYSLTANYINGEKIRPNLACHSVMGVWAMRAGVSLNWKLSIAWPLGFIMCLIYSFEQIDDSLSCLIRIRKRAIKMQNARQFLAFVFLNHI